MRPREGVTCYDDTVGATFRYQEFLDPSLLDLIGKNVRCRQGEASFELLVERLRPGELSPSKDLVFSDHVFRPFEDAREFLDVCPGIVDVKKRRQARRTVIFAVAFSALVVAFFVGFFVLHVFVHEMVPYAAAGQAATMDGDGCGALLVSRRWWGRSVVKRATGRSATEHL